MNGGFWDVNAGHFIILGGFIVSFWTANAAHTRRTKDQERRGATMEQKVDTLYHWFMSHVTRLESSGGD